MNPKSLTNKNTEVVVHESKTDSSAKKLLIIQFILVLLVAFIFFYYYDLFSAQSAIFGGAIAMLNVWIADRKLQAANKLANVAAGSEINLLYLGAVQRFISTLMLFIIGMSLLKLMPLALISAFAAAQLAYLFKGIE